MHIEEVFVPMAGMLMIVSIVALATRAIAAASLNRTIREALRSDPGSVPILAERLDARPLWGDYLLGWIFVAFTVALLLLALTDDDAGARREMLRGAIVPAIVGATVLTYAWFSSRRAAADRVLH
jgi:hypothetical protein